MLFPRLSTGDNRPKDGFFKRRREQISLLIPVL